MPTHLPHIHKISTDRSPALQGFLYNFYKITTLPLGKVALRYRRERKDNMGSWASGGSSGLYNQCPEHETLEFAEETRSSQRVALFRNEGPWVKNKGNKKKSQVFLEGYVETSEEDELCRAKSLTDEDLEELKGCLDLGFGFSYEEIPELCNTLPALELCYSMSQKFLDEQQKSPDSSPSTSMGSETPIANWKISSPGDHPEDVKARLKLWAQVVACTVRLCS